MSWRHLACMLVLLAASPALAGDWSHEVDGNDGDVLSYREDGQIVFWIGCGRGFAIHARYPGLARKEGPVEIVIASSKGRKALKGEFEDPALFNGTDFRQTYLGLARNDPRVFSKSWNAEKARLLDLLDTKGPITIAAAGTSYQLPPVDAGPSWRKALEACRN